MIDISEWSTVEEGIGVYPEGKWPKILLRCPKPSPEPALHPGHRYLFKVSRPPPRVQTEYWAEIIAAGIGAFVGVPVPNVFPAHRNQQPGALVEWFYGRDALKTASFEHAERYLDKRIPDYDRKSGRQHNWKDVAVILEELQQPPALLQDPFTDFARMLVFDALIGNTDRHPRNWGFVWVGPQGQSRCLLAPAFDNGTSLGFEMPDADLRKRSAPASLAQYLDNGRSHMKLTREDDRISHWQLLSSLVALEPAFGSETQRMAAVDPAALLTHLEPVFDKSMEHGLTLYRKEWICALLHARHRRLKDLSGC